MAFLSHQRRFSVRDRHNGYQTHRTRYRWLVATAARRIDAFHPDVVMTQLNVGREVAAYALARGLPVTLSVHDAEFHRWKWPAPHPRLKFITNSRFIASRLRDQLHLESAVIYPVVRLENYKVSSRVPEFVAFVNPIPEKGLDLALEIAAALPNYKFLFVESWPLECVLRRDLLQRLRPLPNITFTRWTPDIRTIYSRTALLILPSQWEEAFARVIPEAQVNGIPVLARDVGGISEAIGTGGILLSRQATAREWADEIQRLLTDRSYYSSRSAAAIANTVRPHFDPKCQMERYLALVSNL
jgi:glycosyltransferase involved in cell wall biosynthesis